MRSMTKLAPLALLLISVSSLAGCGFPKTGAVPQTSLRVMSFGLAFEDQMATGWVAREGELLGVERA